MGMGENKNYIFPFPAHR